MKDQGTDHASRIANPINETTDNELDSELAPSVILSRQTSLTAIPSMQNKVKTMQSKNPIRQHTPDDDPQQRTPGTGQDVCPECKGTGKRIDTVAGRPTDKVCERCDGTGKVVQAIG